MADEARLLDEPPQAQIIELSAKLRGHLAHESQHRRLKPARLDQLLDGVPHHPQALGPRIEHPGIGDRRSIWARAGGYLAVMSVRHNLDLTPPQLPVMLRPGRRGHDQPARRCRQAPLEGGGPIVMRMRCAEPIAPRVSELGDPRQPAPVAQCSPNEMGRHRVRGGEDSVEALVAQQAPSSPDSAGVPADLRVGVDVGREARPGIRRAIRRTSGAGPRAAAPPNEARKASDLHRC